MKYNINIQMKRYLLGAYDLLSHVFHMTSASQGSFQLLIFTLQEKSAEAA